MAELERFPSINWSPLAKQIFPAATKKDFINSTSRRTSVRFGQTTPVASLPEETEASGKSWRKASTIKSKQNDSAEVSVPLKLNRPRKSNKKPLTKDQEEIKRKKSLERNQVAADKCRQNRKKRIDDLQAKAHFLGAKNAAKRSLVKEIKQEIVQLSLMLLIHSRSCNDRDILNRAEDAARQVEQDAHTKMEAEDTVSTFSPRLDKASSSFSESSPCGFAIISDAVSRRYSVVTTDDEVMSPMTSRVFSGQSSRRPSIVEY